MSIFESIAGFVSGLFKPAADLIDDLHYSGEEKGLHEEKMAELKIKLQTIEKDIINKLVESEDKVREWQFKALELQNKLAIAETQSPSKLTSSWRPITSLVLMGSCIIQILWFKTVTPELMHLTEAFLGIYAGGRSAESITKTISSALSQIKGK